MSSVFRNQHINGYQYVIYIKKCNISVLSLGQKLNCFAVNFIFSGNLILICSPTGYKKALRVLEKSKFVFWIGKNNQKDKILFVLTQ